MYCTSFANINAMIGILDHRFIGRLTSICTDRSLLVLYGGEKFVSKNVSKRECWGRNMLGFSLSSN